ncbi:nitrite reductase (NADH) small subunit [Lysinibacillus composti]|uniref:Nitrite reductase small subunit NirD n=1 Tax=Lysinibacillus composti TaxID=720633 RepID=A0A3N9ULA9_9BACI|nr:nitrite reductase small subunit NirD [Lysinibacillus composti]MBM7607360.1 nitrite reductase (NADH) small subunit [Lysinibacillus composti]RQW76078.1 nitrite reductase small subunit NirD [Lysinibacillus composti]
MERIAERIKVLQVEDIAKDFGKTLRIGELEIALFRLKNGEFYAIENRCPHKGGVLVEGMVSGQYVFCPMHDWKIDVTDGKVQEPDHGCVKTYDVEVNGNDVFILLK